MSFCNEQTETFMRLTASKKQMECDISTNATLWLELRSIVSFYNANSKILTIQFQINYVK